MITSPILASRQDDMYLVGARYSFPREWPLYLHWNQEYHPTLTRKVLVATIDAQWEGMGDVGSARYEPALLPPCPTIRVLSYSN